MAKRVDWIGSSREDLKQFPQPARAAIGYALWLAQKGAKHPDVKPLKGFGGAGVLEIVEDYDGDAFRAVYTVQFETAIYTLHAFQKKSKKGIATPKSDMEVIRLRLKQAADDYRSIK